MRFVKISICPFQGGDVDVILIDDKGREIQFTEKAKNMSKEELEIADYIAPACVWTTYQRVTPED